MILDLRAPLQLMSSRQVWVKISAIALACVLNMNTLVPEYKACNLFKSLLEIWREKNKLDYGLHLNINLVKRVLGGADDLYCHFFNVGQRKGVQSKFFHSLLNFVAKLATLSFVLRSFNLLDTQLFLY